MSNTIPPPESSSTDATTRRAALKTLVVAAVAGPGTVLASQAVAASQASEYDAPSEVTSEFDEEFLRRYQPLLYTSSQHVRDNLAAMYGYKVTSEESEYAIAAYWTKYAVQHGITIPFTDIAIWGDDHFGDHEPSYVVVHEPSGEVESVIATGYHHFAMEVAGDEAGLSTHRADHPTHVSLRVIDPWHHYQLEPTNRGSFFELRDFTAVRDNWARDGVFDSTFLPTVDNPFIMRERNSWWRYDTTDYRMARLWLLLGLRGAGDRGDLRRE